MNTQNKFQVKDSQSPTNQEEPKEKRERPEPLSLEDEDYDLWIFKMFYERK